MNRWLRVFSSIASALALLIAVCIFLPDRYYQRAAQSITNLLTDRHLQIGSFTTQRGLQTVIELSDISFSNAQWSDRRNMVEVEQLSATINLSALLQGMLEISSFSFSELKLHLEKNAKGQFNWQLSENSQPKPILSRIRLLELSSENSLIEYSDYSAEVQHRLELQSLNLKAKNDTHVPAIEAQGTLNGFPVAIDTLLQNPESRMSEVNHPSPTQFPFGIKASIGDIDITASGHVNTSDGNAMINSDVSVHVDNLQDLAKLIKTELPEFGPLAVNATVVGNLTGLKDDGLQASDIRLVLDDENLVVNGTGAFVGIPSKIRGDMQLNINSMDTETLFRTAGINSSLPGQAKIMAMLHAENRRVDLSLHQAQFASEMLNLQMSGKIDDVLNSALASIEVDLEAPDMSLVTQLSGQSMPSEWGPVSASALLTGANGTYAMNEIVATLSGNSTATATGSIASLMPFDDLQLDVDAHLFTLAEVSAFTPAPLPDMGPFSGNGSVVWENGELSLLDAKASYNGPLGVAVATGNIGDLIKFDRVRLRADADLPDFKALDLFTGFTMPAVDSVVVSTNLFSTEARDLSARNLNVTAETDKLSISANGSVDSIIKNKAILNLQLATQLDSIKQLESLVSRKLPDVGPVNATARLLGSGQDIKLADIDVALDDSLLNGSISSNGAYLNRIDTLSFNTDLKTVSVKDTLARIGVQTDLNGPAAVSGQVLLDISGKSIKLDDAHLSIAGNTLTAELDLLDIIDPETRSQITGSITLVDLNMMQLRPKPMVTRSVSDTNIPTDMASTLLPDTTLPLGFIARNDLNLRIRIGQFMSNLLDVSDASLNVGSKNGLLTIGPFSGMVNQGQTDFQLVIDTSQKPSAVSLTADLMEFDLARAGLLQNSDVIENGGSTTLMLKLDARGNSLAEILGSANGEGGLYVENLVLKQGVLRALSSDLLDQLADAINPSKERSKETRLICSALAFELNDGTLETPMGFAVDSDKFAILGEANIDFSDEVVSVMINSKPKKGLGFSLNRFINLVEIEGRLAAPQLSLNETGLFRLGASLAAAVASSGVSLLAEGLWELQQANSNVCAQALGK